MKSTLLLLRSPSLLGLVFITTLFLGLLAKDGVFILFKALY